MKFDKSKVYTALNADELKVGSKVYLADNLADLRNQVEADRETTILSSISPDNHQCRFCFCEGVTGYALAYLVDEPEDGKLKWTDLKVGDVIRLEFVDHNTLTGCVIECMITEIDRQATQACHIRAGVSWLTDEALRDWKKVE